MMIKNYINKINFLGLAGLLLGFEAFAQEPAPVSVQQSASPSQTLDETLQFIAEKVALYGAGEYSGMDLYLGFDVREQGEQTRSYTQKVEKEADCMLRVTYQETTNFWDHKNGKIEKATITRIPLEPITVSVQDSITNSSLDHHEGYGISIVARKRGIGIGLFHVIVDATHFYPNVSYNPKGRKSSSNHEYLTSGPSHREDLASDVTIYLSDKEAAEDVRNALSHAVDRCQGKTAPVPNSASSTQQSTPAVSTPVQQSVPSSQALPVHAASASIEEQAPLQTLDEALQFVTENVALYGRGSYVSRSDAVQYMYSQRIRKEDDCSLRFTYKQTGIFPSSDPLNVREEGIESTLIPLDSKAISVVAGCTFDSSSTPISYPDRYSASAISMSSTIAFPHEYDVTHFFQNGSSNPSRFEDLQPAQCVYFSDPKIAESVRKALIHAVDLCQTKRK